MLYVAHDMLIWQDHRGVIIRGLGEVCEIKLCINESVSKKCIRTMSIVKYAWYENVADLLC